MVIQALCTYIRCSDIDKDEWFEEPGEVTKDLRKFCSLKLPRY